MRARADLAQTPPIGGFFEAHPIEGGRAAESVLDAWTQGRPYAAFATARAALAALGGAFAEAQVWLPAFICADVACPALAARTRFYPVARGFRPDLSRVAAEARPGDLVLLVAYFGLPLPDAARALAAARPDLRLVEDRAQALEAGPALPGAWTLHSPRKLLGVADGGLLVAPDAAAILPHPSESSDGQALWRAPLQRLADPEGRDNRTWHAANQAKERALSTAPLAITARSLDVLAAAPVRPLAERRMANWRALDERLRAWSALAEEPAAPPLGYVLRLHPERRDEVLGALHAERIFAAVHWPRIAAPAARFPREAAWTRELLTLPCDHRYGAPEMSRIADVVAARLS